MKNITTQRIIIAGALVMISLLLVLVILQFLAPLHPEKKPTVETEERSYRPVYHFSVPDKWMNDPQRPLYFDGTFHYYYLYNRDYPKGNGTEWRQATSKDLIHWTDKGVAIPKYTNKNGDIWTGSVVRDSQNTAGFGKNALVAIVTQPPDGRSQEQFLWDSTDGGKTFKQDHEQSVMPNPGVKDYRDPKVIWDTARKKWVLLLAEGAKIGFYESENLKDWRYMSGFTPENIGLIECPDLFQLRAANGTVKWVLGASANGRASGQPNTYAYWIGNFDGEQFTPDQPAPQWLDYGFDWYAAVTFENENPKRRLDSRYAIAWMNNWDYPNTTPTLDEDFNGVNSIVRTIHLAKHGQQYSLISKPISALNKQATATQQPRTIHVNGNKALGASGTAYQIDTDISWTDARNIGLRLRESSNKKRHIDVGILTEDHALYVNRRFTNQPDDKKQSVESRAPLSPAAKKIHLKILVDKTSIEVFTGDERTVLTNEAFPPLADQGISLYAEGGTAVFSHFKIEQFKPIQ